MNPNYWRTILLASIYFEYYMRWFRKEIAPYQYCANQKLQFRCMSNPHQIPFTRILVMSVLFGVAYFAIYYRMEGYAQELVMRSVAGSVLFGVFYFFSGRLLRRWLGRKDD